MEDCRSSHLRRYHHHGHLRPALPRRLQRRLQPPAQLLQQAHLVVHQPQNHLVLHRGRLDSGAGMAYASHPQRARPQRGHRRGLCHDRHAPRHLAGAHRGPLRHPRRTHVENPRREVHPENPGLLVHRRPGSHLRHLHRQAQTLGGAWCQRERQRRHRPDHGPAEHRQGRPRDVLRPAHDHRLLGHQRLRAEDAGQDRRQHQRLLRHRPGLPGQA